MTTARVGSEPYFIPVDAEATVSAVSGSSVELRRARNATAFATLAAGSSQTITEPCFAISTGERSDIEIAEVVAASAAAGDATSSLTLPANSICAIGDSLTDADNPANGGIEVYPQVGSRSYLLWAVLLSGGRLRYRGVSATSGYTSQQVLDEHLPVVLAMDPAPAYCAVLAGRNPDGSLATTKANLSAMYDALLTAGIVPIACTLPPSNLEGASARDHELMAWIVTTAQRLGIPCADFYSPLVADTGGYGTTAGGTSYGFEGVNPVHQSAAGAKVMGQVLVDALDPHLGARPWILPAQGAGDTTSLYDNPLFLDDTDADGRPDGWQAPSGAPTMALVDDATVGKGKVWEITRGTATMDCYGDGWNVTAGHRLLLSVRLAATVQNGDANRDTFQLDLMRQDLGNVACNFAVARDVAAGSEFAAEFVVPAGYTGIRPHLQFGGGGTAGSIAQLAQFTCVDLTAAGF
ncbi:MAG TPA: GDSL-type esterase/lipase family protein [Baekduia sp.]|nr:GDSL-type esterase/lipase family protein [Baekduia sp.]